MNKLDAGQLWFTRITDPPVSNYYHPNAFKGALYGWSVLSGLGNRQRGTSLPCATWADRPANCRDTGPSQCGQGVNQRDDVDLY